MPLCEGAEYSTPKLCDTSKTAFTFISVPCLIPFYKDNKLVGYTEKNKQWSGLYTSLTLSGITGNASIGSIISDYSPSKLIQFSADNLLRWSVDYPRPNDKKYIIHMKRKYLHWLNDSTATYNYPNK